MILLKCGISQIGSIEILNRMIHDYQKMADHIGVESEIEFKVGKWYTPVEEYLK